MLSDTKLHNLKLQDKLYKVNDRDGLYVAVTKAGSISFRCNYSINGRQETLTFGRYGVGGITLAEAREQLGEAKKMIAAGKSPAKEKAHVKDAETFGAWSEKWPRGYQMADSTRDMRKAVAESFFQLLKRERIRRKIYGTREDAKSDVFDYIEMFYNPKRRHGFNNQLSPVNFEKQYFERLASV
jgi:hypothetical protein